MTDIQEMDTLQTMVADYRCVFPKESAIKSDAEIADIVLCQEGISHEYIDGVLLIGGVRIY